MKKISCSFIAFFGYLVIHAQISLNLQIPGAGFVDRQQLWDMVVMNNGKAPVEVFIRMSLQEVTNGQVLLTAQSAPVWCSPGAKVINERLLQPVLYNNHHPDMNRRYLPLGTYVLCFRAYTNGLKGEEPLAEECINIHIDPLSPVMLTSPENKAVVYTPYPQFSWIPPAPFEMFTTLQYLISVCEVKAGQQPIEAMMENIPIYTRGNLTQPYEQMNTSFSKLETGKTYAWQVTAVNGTNFSGKTEVWTFTIGKDSVAALVSGAPYVKLSNSPSEPSIAHQGFLKLNYRNTLTDSIGQFTVRNISNTDGKEAPVVFQFSMPLVRGENFIEYDMSKHKKLDKLVYELAFKNSAGQLYYMRFIPVYYR